MLTLLFVMMAFRISDCYCYRHCCHCGMFYCAWFLCRDDRQENEDAQQGNVDHHSFGLSYHTTRGDRAAPSSSYATTSHRSLPVTPSSTILITIRTTTTLPWRGNSSAVLTLGAAMATQIKHFNELVSTTPGFVNCMYAASLWPNDASTFEILPDYTGVLWETFVCVQNSMRGHVKYLDLYLKHAPNRETSTRAWI